MAQRYLRALSATWAATRRAHPISATALETFLFYVASKVRRCQERSFRFRFGPYPFWARPADSNALEEVLLNGEYAFAIRVVTEVPDTPVVIDGGANIGLFSLTILAARPDAEVYSLEPGARTFDILRRNVRASARPGWNVFRVAFWKENGPILFSTRDASTASRVYELEPGGEAEMVQALTLGAFIARYIAGRVALLKLDIEGAEEVVLTYSEAVLPRVDNLIVEIHPALADEGRVMNLINRHFPYVHRVAGRRSTKPLVFASRTYARFPG